MLVLELLEQLLILRRVDHAEENGALPHVLHFAHAGRPHFEEDVRLRWQRHSGVCHGGLDRNADGSWF